MPHTNLAGQPFPRRSPATWRVKRLWRPHMKYGVISHSAGGHNSEVIKQSMVLKLFMMRPNNISMVSIYMVYQSHCTCCKSYLSIQATVYLFVRDEPGKPNWRIDDQNISRWCWQVLLKDIDIFEAVHVSMDSHKEPCSPISYQTPEHQRCSAPFICFFLTNGTYSSFSLRQIIDSIPHLHIVTQLWSQ